MKRPRTTAKVIRGLNTVYSWMSTEINADTLRGVGLDKTTVKEAENAVEYLGKLIEWHQARRTETN
jgi:hypothetical protein